MDYSVKHFDDIYDIAVEKYENSFSISISGKEYNCTGSLLNEELSILQDNKVIHSVVAKNHGRYYIYLNGETFEFDEILEHVKDFKSQSNEQIKSQIVIAPMPGKIIKTCVKEAEKVTAGQLLLIMESMKMETSIEATIDGKVRNLHVTSGDSIVDGQKLIEIEAE